LLLILPLIAACQPQYSQNRYSQSEAGQATEVEQAKIISVKKINIQGENQGIGATAGVIGGSAAGYQFGNGSGQLGAVIAGIVIGGIVGQLAEDEAKNHQGYQYIVLTEKKKTKSITQYAYDGDVVFKKGDKVILQTSGSYQRLLPLAEE
jgi:outer membrane lipoprotein SlyB